MRTQILVHKWAPRTVADPDLQIRRGGGHPVPEIRGGGGAGLKKFFSALQASAGGGGGSGPSGPLPWIRHSRPRFLALFCGHTKQEFSSICGAGYFLVAYIPYKNLPQ